MVSVVDYLAVCDLYIFEFFVVEKHTGEHYKRNINFFGFAVDFYCLILAVGVVKVHCDLSAFARELFGSDRRAV